MNHSCLCWEDVEVGMDVPSLQKLTTPIQLIKYAGAEEDFYELHVSEVYAQSIGFARQIDHGMLKNHFLEQMLSEWIGISGTVRILGCQYRKLSFPNEPSICKGKVTGKRVEDGKYLVDCSVWIEDGKGEIHTPGHATVSLPSRNATSPR